MQRGHTGDLHYYSNHLLRKLRMIRTASAAVIEAPSGYGKTTAIRDLLAEVQQNTPVYWFTATDETPDAGFQRLCREVEKIDNAAGQRLMRIGLPNAATVGEACDALRSIECQNETYLVIDNFHYMQGVLSSSFLKAVLEHGGEGLHIIIIAQMLTREMLSAVSGRGILHITVSDLRLDREDIRRYYALSGVDLSAENAGQIARYTEGWIIAVYLQLCAYRITGSFFDTSGIYALMERLIWDTLTEAQRTFLLCLSPFETVTVPQACMLFGFDTLPEYAQSALNIPFIHYSFAEQRYDFHDMLSEVLVRKRKERGGGFERECLVNAGDYYRKKGMTEKALALYVQAEAYERIFSLDLSDLLLGDIGGLPFSELAVRIVRTCPGEIRDRHPLSLLQIAWALLMAGKHAEFDILMEKLRERLEKASTEDTAHLRGEWWLLSAWRRLPRIDEMIECVHRAVPLFGDTRSQVILPSAPWCLGDYSQLSAFHTRPGEADREVDALAEYIALYSPLTNGHGRGADVLFRAEIAHYRGNLGEAEILAYKASFLAESSRQGMIQLGAALHLAEIAVEKSDMVRWQLAIDSMERAASYPEQSSFVLRSAVEMLRALLFNELQHQERVSDWLKNGETEGRILPAMRRNALFIRLCYFMQEGENSRLAGMAEAERMSLRPEHVLADILLSLLAAIGYLSAGNAARAEELSAHAVEIALPDGFTYLLAVYYWMLQGLPENLIRERFPEHLTQFIEIKERFIAGFTKLHREVTAGELPDELTVREREVAVLAASGLRNGEIAKKLFVSESTVRAHMRTVFQKLDIDRRAKLAEKLR